MRMPVFQFPIKDRLSVLLLFGGFGLLTALHAGAFIVLSSAQLGKDAGLRAGSLKSSERIIQRLIFLEMDFRHCFPSSRGAARTQVTHGNLRQFAL